VDKQKSATNTIVQKGSTRPILKVGKLILMLVDRKKQQDRFPKLVKLVVNKNCSTHIKMEC